MSLTLYFLRHGQTPYSRANAFCGSGINPELTEDGVAMANAFADKYRATAWSAIYASPLRRTVMTAEPLCGALGIGMELREDLMEINYGKWEGQSIDSVSQDYRDDYLRWSADPAWCPPTEGEMAVAIERRALRVIEEIKQTYPAGNVLVVSHKATIRIILCALMGIDVGRFRYRLACPVGSVSIIEFSPHGPLLRALADCGHQDERLRSLPGT